VTETLVIENGYRERTMTVTDQPPRREMPVSTVQLAHATSDAVITGLGRSPYLLGLVILVIIVVAAAIYFLQILITGQATHLAALLAVQNKQQTEIITLHKQEFDALLDAVNRLSPAPNQFTMPAPLPPPRGR
jgi:hypothetical protein